MIEGIRKEKEDVIECWERFEAIEQYVRWGKYGAYNINATLSYSMSTSV